VKIGVLMKQVPDSDTKVKVKPDGSGIETADVKYIMNPYDEFAVEEALKLQAQLKGEVVVFTFGPKRAEDAMRNALAMGADRGVRIDDTGVEGSDSYGVGRVLAAAAKAEGVDILFAGKQAIDDDAMQVPQIIAELLDWPHVTLADKFEAHDEKTATVSRRVGGGAKEIIRTSLPAVITAEKGLNTPRYASLPGIMKAKKKPIDVKSPADLGVPAAELGAAGALVKMTKYSPPPARKAGRVLNGDLQQAAAELVRLLHEEAKVI
jgi:electron transfer flavoprotein beta subunit